LIQRPFTKCLPSLVFGKHPFVPISNIVIYMQVTGLLMISIVQEMVFKYSEIETINVGYRRDHSNHTQNPTFGRAWLAQSVELPTGSQVYHSIQRDCD
jgi:hypothetical protein